MRLTGSRPRFGANLTPAVRWLIGITVAGFVIFAVAGGARDGLLAALLLTPASLLRLELWKLVTTAFVPANPLNVIIDVLVLWMFMPFLERAWGTRRFLVFGAVTTLAGNLVASLVGLLLGGSALAAPIAGLSPFIFAGMIGYGVAFSDMPVSFFGVLPMKGKTLAIGMAAVVLLMALLGGNFVQGAGYIAAMVAAFLMTSKHITPRVWILRWRRARIKRRYRVLDGGKERKWLN